MITNRSRQAGTWWKTSKNTQISTKLEMVSLPEDG